MKQSQYERDETESQRNLWHKVYNKMFYVCTQRRCRLPRTILSRSRPDPRNNLLVLVVETTTGGESFC